MQKRLVDSFGYAFRGLRYAFRTQRNIKIHSVFAVFAITLGIVLQISRTEMSIIVLLISTIIVLELLNTVIEEIVNMLTLSRKIRAMVTKDVAAAAVLVAATSSVVIGALIFLPRIYNFFLAIR